MQTPVEPVQQPTAQVEPVATPEPVAQAENKIKEVNERIAAQTKTVADAAPLLVNIPDSLKHLDNTANNNVSQVQPKVTTPPPTPVQQKVTPPPAPVVPVNTPPVTPANNVNEAFSLFETATSHENAGKWGSTPIADLGKSIGLNDKISMIKELFSDDQHAFNNSLTQLNNIGGFEAAKDYMMRNLVNVYNWNQAGKVERAQQFINLVRRRYS